MEKIDWIIYGIVHMRSGIALEYDAIQRLKSIRRLTKKHDSLAVMDCNGFGFIRGQAYYNGSIDDYAKRTYGAGVKSAYIKGEETIFDKESHKVTEKISAQLKLISADTCLTWTAEYQGDPRGATVRLFCYAGGGLAGKTNLNELLYI